MATGIDVPNWVVVRVGVAVQGLGVAWLWYNRIRLDPPVKIRSQKLAEAELARRRQPYLRERLQNSRESEALVRTLGGYTDAVNGVALTPDGRRAVSASDDGTLKVWDLTTGQVIIQLKTNAPLPCVAITEDQKLIVARDSAGAVHFVEWVRWEPLRH